MKDINKLKNYREKYKRYYGIDFGEDYVVHHIDLDRTNNDISNLVLLPKELHAKYHLILTAITDGKKPDGIVDLRLSNYLITDRNPKILALLPETIEECSKWIKWKQHNYSQSLQKTIFEEIWYGGN